MGLAARPQDPTRGDQVEQVPLNNPGKHSGNWAQIIDRAAGKRALPHIREKLQDDNRHVFMGSANMHHTCEAIQTKPSSRKKQWLVLI